MNDTPDILIHPYRPADREAVRRICCDTADCGRPVESFFPDREVFADLITLYYTDYEPGSSWVAEQGGAVAGYLNGCLETRRFSRTMTLRIMPRLWLKSLRRGTLWHPQVRMLAWRSLGIWIRYGAGRSVDVSVFPSHLHVNLAADVRAHGIGHRLVERFCEQARAAGSAGIHANVREDNEAGRRFFERQGFRALFRRAVMRTETGMVYAVVYGKAL